MNYEYVVVGIMVRCKYGGPALSKPLPKFYVRKKRVCDNSSIAKRNFFSLEF